MATETVASDHTSAIDEQYEKKENEANGQKSVSLSIEHEDKHDKPEDAQCLASPSSKAEGEAEGDEKKVELTVVEVEKSDDSPALEASADDNLKHDKIEDAPGPAATLSKIEGEAEGDEMKAEPAVVVVEKTDDSLSLEAYVADNLKEEKELIPDSQTISVTEPAHDAAKSQPEELTSTESTVKETPQELEKESTETEEEKIPKTADIPEATAETIEKSSSTTEANPQTETEAELVKETENLETSSQKVEKPEPEITQVQEKTEEPEKESQEKALEAEQPHTVAIPEPSAETNENQSDAIEEKTREPEFDAEVLKETNNYKAGPTETEKAEPVVTKVKESPEELEKQSFEQEEEEQPNTVTIPEPSAETNEKQSDAIEEKTREPKFDAEVLKDTNNYEAGHTETEKAEPVIAEVEESPKESEKQSFQQEDEEQPKTVAIPDSAETNEKPSDAIDEKTSEPEFDAEVLKETNNYEAGPTETENEEPVVTEVEENPSEQEKQSLEQEKEEQPKTVIPETAAESAEEPGDVVEVHPPKELDIELVKETGNSESEAVPGKAEKPGHIAVVHPSKESDTEVVKETGNSEPEAVPGKAEKPGDIVMVQPPKEESDIEAVKEIGKSESEAGPGKAEKPELVSTEVEEKPRELFEVAEEVGETSKDMETKQELVLETAKSEGTSDDTIKDPISQKEEKAAKEEETGITGNSAVVSLNEEAQAAPANLVESFPGPGVAEKVVEEDGKKESSLTNVIEGVSKEVVGVLKYPEQDSTVQEAKADLKEEREYPAPKSVEEKVAVAVAVAANDDKKEPETPDVVEGSTREAEVEIKKVEEQIEAKTGITEAGGVKVENVKGDRPAVDEIATAVSEPVRETLASKFKEKEEESIITGEDNLENEQIENPVKTEVQVPEPPTRESDATKTSKDLPKETPAKPAQKQSNNIISKVKQSLVKAKKAITGKSPSSKNLSSEAKGDIKVK